jgi:hypothetical protein
MKNVHSVSESLEYVVHSDDASVDVSHAEGVGADHKETIAVENTQNKELSVLAVYDAYRYCFH